jgi:hypothetical protein
MDLRTFGYGQPGLRSAIRVVPALLLVACTVRLVTPYDEVVDNGLVSFNEAFLQFMAQIKQEVPGEQGSYGNNTDFYNTQQAKLGTLVQRSQAVDPKGSCPGTELTEEAVKKINSLVIPSTAKQPASSAAKSTDAPAPTGSCMTMLLTNIQEQLTDTACFHLAIYGQTSTTCEARGFKQSVADSLKDAPLTTKQTLLGQIEDAVTASVTAAMTLELAKKQGTEQGGS